MIETVLMSPEYVQAAKRAGVYATTLAWLSAHRRGQSTRFPYSPTHMRSHAQSHQLIVSPAAKALDYFQESLALLDIDESEELTHERLKTAFKRKALYAHPDKPTGSKEAFDALKKAVNYVESILNRIRRPDKEERTRQSAPVTMEAALAHRGHVGGAHRSTGTELGPVLSEEERERAMAAASAPVRLSAKKLDMATFNTLFEQNRLPDPSRDTGYGDWLKSQEGGDDIVVDPRLSGGKKVTPQMFEEVFRERAKAQGAGTQLARRLEPDALISPGGVELGADDTGDFTAAFGSDMQFTDLKRAYTTTAFQEIADVKVQERSARTLGEAQRMRAAELARVDPDEEHRLAAAAAAVEQRERTRRLRLAKQDAREESWFEKMKGRMFVTDA